ncbi:MAG TPA: TonB family protein [Terriglobales bacterium]|nr:TonB family protein [Terriglobales bacterium]
MTDAWKQQVGQTIDGQFRLIQYLGGTDHSAVFLTEFGDKRQRFAIKLMGADPASADSQVSRLRRAAKLSHPHLARILQTGRAQIGNASVVYVVTEYAEEDLAQVLPDRPLRPEEVREMLPQVIDALQYLHSQGFVHARLKPSNILAVDEQLKLSSDGICATGERGAPGEKPSPYDPPELAPSGPSPAGDLWSLGMTLVEVLTQRLPIWEWTGHADPPAPRTLPAPFLEITRNCLRRDPAMRCSLREISENLDPQHAQVVAMSRPSIPASPALTSRVASSKPPASSQAEGLPNPPLHRSNSRYAVQAAAFILALAAVIAIPRWFRRSTAPIESEPVAAAAPASSPATSAPAPKPEPAREVVAAPAPAHEPSPAPAAAARSAKVQPEPAESPKALPKPAKSNEPAPSARRSVSQAPPSLATAAVAQPGPAPPPSSSSAVAVRGQVARKAMPDVSQKALDTIHGKVRVSVKITVDPAGKVTQAVFESPGPSKYFADAAMRAAKDWTFAPAKSNGESISSIWLLRFEFGPAGPEAFSAEINP